MIEPLYLGNFSGREDIEEEFSDYGWNYLTNSQRVGDFVLTEGINIIAAYYTYEDYSGAAFVLFEQDGKLYEVNAFHCSCYGLENQWAPEETSLEAVRMRHFYGHLTAEEEERLHAHLERFQREWF